MTAKPSSYVYFLQAGEDGPIKIGVAGDPWARAAGLQTGNHEPLTILHASPGTQADESQLHKRFARLRTRGEWFRPEPELVHFIAGMRWVERGTKDPVPEQPALHGMTRSQVLSLDRYMRVADAVTAASDLEENLRGRERLDPDDVLTAANAIGRLRSFVEADDLDAARFYGLGTIQHFIARLSEILSIHGHAEAAERLREDVAGGTVAAALMVEPDDWGPLSDPDERGEF